MLIQAEKNRKREFFDRSSDVIDQKKFSVIHCMLFAVGSPVA